MGKGAVWLGRGRSVRRLRRGGRKLKPGDIIHLYYNEAVLNETPPAAELIADEGSFSLWYKPYGMRSQGSRWGDHTTIHRWVETTLEPRRPAFIVHRLDRAASGLILIAHSRKVAASLARLFEERRIDKRYRVIVHGSLDSPDDALTIDEPLDGRPATSHVHQLEHDSLHHRSLLEVKLESGRKHQIRRHLAGIGLPVIGDRLYGVGDENVDLQLTACHLSFVSPVNGKVISYDLPTAYQPRLDEVGR